MSFKIFKKQELNALELLNKIRKSKKYICTKQEIEAFSYSFKKPEFTPKEIQEIRKSTKLSQRMFALLINMSSKSVVAWENGTKIPKGTSCLILEQLRINPKALDYRLKNS